MKRCDPSIDNEQFTTARGTGTVRLAVVTNKVALSRFQRVFTAILELRDHFTFGAVDDMSFTAPVVGFVAG